jgi:hypothetical protein
MKVVSYFEPCKPREHFTWWEDIAGLALPIEISNTAIMQYIYGTYHLMGDFDINYCQLGHYPVERPKGFVYTMVSDWISNEYWIMEWVKKVKPDLILCLQQLPDELFPYGAKLMPWCVKDIPKASIKDIKGFISGCTNQNTYPNRSKLAKYLTKFGDVKNSCSTVFGCYPMSNFEYLNTIKRTRYYFSGGIYDRFVPPKYYEAASYGCCIITFDMEMLSKVGFKHNENCIVIKRLEEIDDIIDTDRYIHIGENARQFINDNHTVKVRAKQIREIYGQSSYGNGSSR